MIEKLSIRHSIWLRVLFGVLIYTVIFTSTFAQETSAIEEKLRLKTYAFDDPNPIPIISENPSIYPYYKYDGYSNVPTEKEWKVVTLENELIKVMVLPELGGKVWGAIDKTTGEEFIYKNEVMKFRNISMRGPWTSGGIEFNFGVIGHHPSTASPVDYSFGNDRDGSAYCIVGSIDLPSRTQWRVKIVLKEGVANFETQASWYNPTTYRHAYYNWMTAAAPATEDLTIYAPGDEYLDHGGDPHPYPIDEGGRDLSKYKQNNFGPSKSYHVVGSYDDYFGGYFKNKGFGFGHWSTYDDSPGQKVWLWALSRSGGIWEDLLTDTDGQYIEFQAGRLLNQYAPETKKINPTSKRSFAAGAYDQWRELWFPINGIGGMTDVSEYGVMHITDGPNSRALGINSFKNGKVAVVKTNSDGDVIKEELNLVAMEHHQLELTDEIVQVHIPALDLSWKLEDDSKTIERTFSSTITDSMRQVSNEYTFYLAEQAYVSRHYEKAEKLYMQCITNDPLHLDALTSLGELYVKEAKYTEAKMYLRRALEIDTYHPRANYLIGVLYKIQEDSVNALESLSWATRDIAYQSVAYGAMAEILIRQVKYQEAILYCQKSLETNSRNMQSLLLMNTARRLLGDNDLISETHTELLILDELHDGIQIEALLTSGRPLGQSQFESIFQGEFPDQTLLESVLYYYKLGRVEEAIQVARMMPNPSVMVSLWLAYLENDTDELKSIALEDVDFVLPYRAESIAILDWAIENNPSWKFKYYKSLILLCLRHEEGFNMLQKLENEPQSGLFYLNRSQLMSTRDSYNEIPDLEKANSMSDQWRIDHIRSEAYIETGDYTRALDAVNESLPTHSENYILRMDAIRALLYLGKHNDAIESMAKIDVLPFEGASSGRILYEAAYTGRALEWIKANKYKEAIADLNTAKIWDESMGVGMPYNADERLQDYLLSHCYAKLSMKSESQKALNKVVEYSLNNPDSNSDRRLIGIKALKDLGRVEKLKDLLNQGQTWAESMKELENKKPDLLSSIIFRTLNL